MLGAFIGGWEIILLIPVVLFIIALVLFFFVFWIWMLVDCIKNDRISSNEKIVWALAIVFFHFLGSIIYFFAGRTRQRSVTSPPLA